MALNVARLIRITLLSVLTVAVVAFLIDRGTHLAVENSATEYILETVPGGGESQLAGSSMSQAPKKANDFVNSVGLVTHLTYDSYKAVSFDGVLKPRIAELGVRHIRDTTSTLDGCCGQMFTYSGQLKALGAIGVNTTTSTYFKIFQSNDSNETPIYTADNQNRFVRKIKALVLGSAVSEPTGTVNSTVIQGPSKISAFSSLNEPDHEPGLTDDSWQASFNAVHPTWPQLVVDYSRDLFTALKGDATTASLPIIAPSFVHLPVFPGGVSSTLQGILPYVDRGNVHVYCHKKPPAQCLETQFEPWQSFFNGKTMILTELGYHSVNGAGQATATSEAAIARYLPQAIATYFGLGVERTFIYELMDEGGHDRETSFGILSSDGTPKPAFTAIKNLISLVTDSTSNFNPTNLTYSLEGAAGTTHSMLLQKSTGEHYLLLWGEQGTDSVSIIFDGQKNLSAYRPVESTSALSTVSGSSIDLSITDSMTVLRVASAAAGSSSTTGGSTSSSNKSGSSSGASSNDEANTGAEGQSVAGDSQTTQENDRRGLLPSVSSVVSGWSSEARVAVVSALLLFLSILFVWTFHHWHIDHWISSHILYRLRKLR